MNSNRSDRAGCDTPEEWLRHRPQKQTANTQSGNISQTGRDYTNTTNTRISIWISVVFVTVFAVAASVLVSLFGDHIPGVEIRVDESAPADTSDAVADF